MQGAGQNWTFLRKNVFFRCFYSNCMFLPTPHGRRPWKKSPDANESRDRENCLKLSQFFSDKKTILYSACQTDENLCQYFTTFKNAVLFGYFQRYRYFYWQTSLIYFLKRESGI